jgi:hypothetical protein
MSAERPAMSGGLVTAGEMMALPLLDTTERVIR